MEFKSFTKLVQEEVTRRVGSEYNVMINDVFKNNGLVLTGLSIMTEECNVSPTIYLNHYYESFEKGVLDLDDVVSEVFDIYDRYSVDCPISMDFFTDFNNIKDKIIFKLVNTERNKELLQDVPHVDIFDLSMIFQCLVSNDRMGTATITIHNSHLELWEVDEEQLHELAIDNTPRLQKYCIMNIIDMIRNLDVFNNLEIDEEMLARLPFFPMYVLTNESKNAGAACFLYRDLLKDLSQAFGCNLIIIPSSIHETIIVPDRQDDYLGDIKQMVIDINASYIPPEEVLSDSVYYYNMNLDDLAVL